MKPPQRILIYRLGSMGDTLVALPCIHSLRRRFPDVHITWLTNLPINLKARASADLLEGTGLVNEYINYTVGLRDFRLIWRLMSKLTVERYDLVIDLAAARGWTKTLRDAAFFALCGYWRVVGLPWRERDLRCQLDPERQGFYEPESRRLARRMRILGAIDLTDRSLWSLQVREDELAFAGKLLARAGVMGHYIVASVGTKAEAKDWTEQNWLAMLTMLAVEKRSLGLVMLGAPDEAERSQRCLDVWKGPGVNLAGALTVRESASILKNAVLFIGHDSGPMHLAASVNTRCIAIFSARNLPGHWFPAGERHKVFYNQTECFGCGLERCDVHKKKCILSTKPDEVCTVAIKMLDC